MCLRQPAPHNGITGDTTFKPRDRALGFGEEKHLLVAESKQSESPFTIAELAGLVREVARKPLPPVGAKFKYVERALCIPTCKGTMPEKIEGVWIVSGGDVFAKPLQTK